MASYGALLRSIPTSEINRLLLDKKYSRWAYFLDEAAFKAGVVFANDNEFGAYTIIDEPDPKLRLYGLEPIAELEAIPDTKLLIVSAGDRQLRALIFNDLSMVEDDDISPNFNYDIVHDWQHFLATRQVAIVEGPHSYRAATILLKIILAAIAGFIAWKLFSPH